MYLDAPMMDFDETEEPQEQEDFYYEDPYDSVPAYYDEEQERL